MEKNGKNVIVTILMENAIMKNILGEAFDGKKGVSIVDLMGTESDLAKKFIENFGADIAIISQDTFADTESRNTIYDMIKSNRDTHYVTIYNGENAHKIKELNEILLKNRLPLTTARVDEKEDCEILAQTIEGIINGKKQFRDMRRDVTKESSDKDNRGEE